MRKSLVENMKDATGKPLGDRLVCLLIIGAVAIKEASCSSAHAWRSSPMESEYLTMFIDAHRFKSVEHRRESQSQDIRDSKTLTIASMIWSVSRGWIVFGYIKSEDSMWELQASLDSGR